MLQLSYSVSITISAVFVCLCRSECFYNRPLVLWLFFCLDDEDEDESREESGMDWDDLEEEARKGGHDNNQCRCALLGVIISSQLTMKRIVK